VTHDFDFSSQTILTLITSLAEVSQEAAWSVIEGYDKRSAGIPSRTDLTKGMPALRLSYPTQ
jgi:hypothetical protein